MNGANADPLYKFLKSSKGGFFGDSIKWNFSKFLVDKEGNVVDRYAPTTSPLSIEVKGTERLFHLPYIANPYGAFLSDTNFFPCDCRRM